MTYSVKEIYLTVQGEGAQTGIPAVFLRFTGCNLWSGLEKDRASAICKFCDTDFIGTDGPNGGKFKTAAELDLKLLNSAGFFPVRIFVLSSLMWLESSWILSAIFRMKL